MLDGNRSAIERLLAVAASIAQARTRAQVLRVVLGDGIESLDAYVGVVALIRADGLAIEVLDYAGMTPADVGRYATMMLEPAETPLAVAARTGAPLWVSRADSAARFPKMPLRPRTAALAALPLVVEGRTFGVIGLAFSQTDA